MDCIPPGSSGHGISQARILQRVAISFSIGSSWHRDWTCSSCITGRFFACWVIREVYIFASIFFFFFQEIRKYAFFSYQEVKKCIFIYLINIYWSRVDVQCCVSFRCTAEWISYTYTQIQPVHPKGNQSWMFIGRTDVEAETPIFWPPDVKNWLIWKDPDARKDWRQEEKGTTEDEMVGWHHWFSGHEFE